MNVDVEDFADLLKLIPQNLDLSDLRERGNLDKLRGVGGVSVFWGGEVEGEAVEILDHGLGSVLVDHGDDGITSSGNVDVGDFAAKPLKHRLDRPPLVIAIDLALDDFWPFTGHAFYEKLLVFLSMRTLQHSEEEDGDDAEFHLEVWVVGR